MYYYQQKNTQYIQKKKKESKRYCKLSEINGTQIKKLRDMSRSRSRHSRQQKGDRNMAVLAVVGNKKDNIAKEMVVPILLIMSCRNSDCPLRLWSESREKVLH